MNPLILLVKCKSLLGISQDVKKLWSDFSEEIKSYIDVPLSIEDIRSIYGNVIDKIIINKTDKEFLVFHGGKFFIERLDNDKVKVSFDAYFQTKEKKWIKISNEDQLEKSKINSLDYMKINQAKLEFEIAAPQQK